MSAAILMLMLASWAGCLWLGFQIGRGQSDQKHKHEVEDFERRFKIVNGDAVELHES